MIDEGMECGQIDWRRHGSTFLSSLLLLVACDIDVR
jgi:hypothetical protein